MATIVVISLVAAGGAFMLGYPGAAWGALGATPAALFNYYLMYKAVTAGDGDEQGRDRVQIRLLKRSLLRMGVSVATLLVALIFGAEVVVGALAALVAEMLTYMGDAVRLIVRR